MPRQPDRVFIRSVSPEPDFGRGIVFRDNSDPLGVPFESPSPESVSVLDPRHPANRPQREENRSSSSYIARIPEFKFSLGWELEANHKATNTPAGINLHHDGSVDGDGAEYVVLPSVTRSPNYVLGLLKDLAHTPRLNTDKSCGFHVHVGVQGAKSQRLKAWAVATEALALEIEDMAFKAVPESRQGNSYCRRIVPLASGTRFVGYKYENERRYHWLNTVEIFRPNGIRTIEMRLLGNTHRWKYLLAWTAFTVSLMREGWKVAHKPFDSRKASLAYLSDMLDAIRTEIKPLEKRGEPVPAWVYSNLKNLGIDFSAFERPLKSLVEIEAETKGNWAPTYSDNQVETPNRGEDDNNEDACPCGCGNDSRCDWQVCEDGDCDRNYCERCHENGNCDGSPTCEQCIVSRHEDGEYCGRTSCGACERRGVGPFARDSEEEAEPPVPSTNGTITGRVTSTSSNIALTASDNIARQEVTVDNFRAAAAQLRSMPISTVDLETTIYQSFVQGSSRYVTAFYDEVVNIGTGVTSVDPILMEHNGNVMLDDHESALSADREHHAPRRLTVAEVEIMNRNNEERLRGNR